MDASGVLVELLLSLALVMANVTWRSFVSPTRQPEDVEGELTRHLLLAIASDGTDDGVDLTTDAVGRALDVLLRLGGVVLGLALRVLVTAGLGPGGGAGEVTDRLDDGALERVVLARRLAEDADASAIEASAIGGG